MPQKSALIVYVGRKHSKHQQIIADLIATYQTTSEIDLPANDANFCSLTADLDSSIQNIDLLVVYLSQDTKNHACVIQAVELANRYGKKIVGIWLEDVNPEDLCGPVGLYGDSISPYDDLTKDIFSGQANVWLNSDYTTPPKTKTKKHTCG
jgi:hypothetical protein